MLTNKFGDVGYFRRILPYLVEQVEEALRCNTFIHAVDEVRDRVAAPVSQSNRRESVQRDVNHVLRVRIYTRERLHRRAGLACS